MASRSKKNKPAFVENADDPQQVKEGKQREKRLRERNNNDMAWVLHDQRGRRVLYRLIKFCRPTQSALGPNDSITNFNVGMQNVGNFIVDEILKVHPESYITMLQEANKEAENAG
jgi:hypothetical protein